MKRALVVLIVLMTLGCQRPTPTYDNPIDPENDTVGGRMIQLISPRSGAFQVYHYLPVSWSSQGIKTIEVKVSVNDGAFWHHIAYAPASNGSFNWYLSGDFFFSMNTWHCWIIVADSALGGPWDCTPAPITVYK